MKVVVVEAVHEEEEEQKEEALRGEQEGDEGQQDHQDHEDQQDRHCYEGRRSESQRRTVQRDPQKRMAAADPDGEDEVDEDAADVQRVTALPLDAHDDQSEDR